MFKVNFKTEGEAFSGSPRANTGEIAFIMQQVLRGVAMSRTEGAIIDSNGHAIGGWSWEKEPKSA
jgi:hypothetical protein